MKEKRLKSKKKILIGIGITICILSIPLIYYLYTGSIFKVAESLNPVGYYRLEIESYEPVIDQNYKVIIYEGIKKLELEIVNGVFDTNATISNIYYAESQSYACIIKESIKTVFIPIECAEDNISAKINSLRVYPRLNNNLIYPEIKLGNETGNYEYSSFDTPRKLLPGNYSISLQIYINEPSNSNYEGILCGGFTVNVSEKALQDFPIAKSIGYNVDAHILLINASVRIKCQSFNGLPFIVTIDNKNYTIFILGPLFIDAPIFYSFTFELTETTIISYCLFDGFLDFAFDPSFNYYKINLL
ncbi:MAG: hypothetical protein ACTSRZ_13020 [Promethearchaeota archaeon]